MRQHHCLYGHMHGDGPCTCPNDQRLRLPGELRPVIKKMRTTRYILMVAAQALVVVSALLLATAAAATAEYVRPAPGRIILTEHTEPADHPQQVLIPHLPIHN